MDRAVGGVVVAIVAAGCAMSGCVTSGSAASASPRSSQWEGPVVVRVAERGGSEDVLNLPEGALTSEVALVNADATDVCFDVKMRTWQGASPEWLVDLTVDDASVAESEVFLRPCTSQSIGPADRVPMTLSCLPVDTAVGSSVTDAGDSIQVRGDRVCLSHGGQLGERSETVKLSLKQGALGYAFVWHFAGHASN